MRLRGTIAVLSALSLAALGLAGCSTGGNSTAGAGGGSGSSGDSAATATFTGDLTGTISMNLCTDAGGDAIFVKIDGDPTKYLGTVGPTTLGFIGPDAKAWTLDATGGATPVAITSGSGGFSMDGVKVHYVLEGDKTQEITVTGKVLCP